MTRQLRASVILILALCGISCTLTLGQSQRGGQSAGANVMYPFTAGGYGNMPAPAPPMVPATPPQVMSTSYGGVASNGYGTPMVSGGYGAPPVSGGYGVPPVSGGYGAPPVSGGYGVPAPSTGYGGNVMTTGYGAGPALSGNADVCGLPGTGGPTASTTQFARMLGGTQVTSNQYCWTCAVFDRGTNTYIGGASIVHRQFLVSSASIFDGHVGNSIVVRCGITNVQSGPTQGPCGQFRDVALVRFAPSYMETDKYYRNNLAILKLTQPLDMSQPCVCKICLPGPTSNYVRQKCTATGYGITKKGGNYPGALYAITVEVINEPECNNALKQVVAGFELHNSQLCAGGQQLDVDACTGDGGSPLACLDQSGLYVLAGVVSSGFQCGNVGVPGLYTNVKIFSPFISAIVMAG